VNSAATSPSAEQDSEEEIGQQGHNGSGGLRHGGSVAELKFGEFNLVNKVKPRKLLRWVC